jgi:predicted ATPase/DNA-binding SARP family transcriptional activator
MTHEQDSPQVAFALLGIPQLMIDGVLTQIERRKALALLAYLAVEPGLHSRDQLATLLTPEADAADARAGLRRALAALTPFARPWLLVAQDTLALQRDARFTLDIDQFYAYLDAGAQSASPERDAQLAAAVALYRGDFMAGFALPDSLAFEEWQFFQAERLRRALADALEQLTRPESAQRDINAAIEYARRWSAIDPLYEPAHQRLMQLYAQSGQQSAAIRQYRALTELLARELNVTPTPETTAIYEQARLGERAGQSSRRSASPVLVSVAPSQQTAAITTPATPFLGRQAELAKIAEDLADPACRLLTLVGPGEMGKTRLALQAAALHQAAFPDGVHQISLVGVNTPERLVATIADGLGIVVQGDPLTSLSARFRTQRALLLLDNVEHALVGSDLPARLLRDTQHLKLLVTSRERLQVQDEWVMDISGLEAPEDADAPDAANYSAVQLFVQRARQARSDFRLTDADLPAIVEICRLVDGMPLAIELAAAWVRVLSCDDILQELRQSMALLTTTLRDVPERHRSIEGVFAQAWEQLTADERQALQRLAVFEDGVPRGAAAEVANASPIVLAALADKALIRRDEAGRYVLHELLRQFAARKLAGDPAEHADIWLRYCRYYTALLERRAADLEGPHQRAALQELSVEFDNIQTAWEYAVDHTLLDELARGLDGLYRCCDLRGWYQDGIAMMRRLTEKLDAPTTQAERAAEEVILEARAQARQGVVLCWIGQFDQAWQLLERALATLRSYDVAPEVAATLNWMGLVAYQRGDSPTAQQFLNEGLAAHQALQLPSGIAWSLDMLGDLASDQGDYDTARDLLNESIMRFTTLGDQVSAAWSLSGLGRVLMLKGELSAARQLLEDNLSLFRSFSDPHGLAITLANVGELALTSDDIDTARSAYRDALEQARRVYAIPLVLDALAGLAMVFSRSGEHERALELATIVRNHPTSWRDSLAWADLVRNAAHSALPEGVCTAIERRSRTEAWEDVAESIVEPGSSPAMTPDI